MDGGQAGREVFCQSRNTEESPGRSRGDGGDGGKARTETIEMRICDCGRILIRTSPAVGYLRHLLMFHISVA